jgi:hypothetical protein
VSPTRARIAGAAIVTPEEAHHEIPKSGHRWIDISVAGCALVVSVTSLFVAMRHGRSMERMAEANAKLVQANSWPVLQRYQSDTGPVPGSKVYSLNVVNNGVGPAKVEAVEVTWKGQPVASVRELVRLCCENGSEANEPEFETSTLMGSVLRAAEVRKIVEFPEDELHDALRGRLHLAMREIRWNVCYCSVFDECWVSNLANLHPDSVKECPVPKLPFRG